MKNTATDSISGNEPHRCARMILPPMAAVAAQIASGPNLLRA
ncbi:MAG: hypothetical protein ACQKBV_08975 [Puniceicoccales bacterium]